MEEGRGEEGIAAARVDGAVHDAAHLGPVKGAGAHRAGLDRHVQRAVRQVLAADGLGGLYIFGLNLTQTIQSDSNYFH